LAQHFLSSAAAGQYAFFVFDRQEMVYFSAQFCHSLLLPVTGRENGGWSKKFVILFNVFFTFNWTEFNWLALA